MGQESQKVIGLLLISVMICAGFANTVNIAKFTENVFNITGKTKEILNSQKDIQSTFLKESYIHSTAEQLLANDDLDLEARTYMAYRISDESKNDLAVIYLISYEIAKIINGEIKAHHRGYLVTKNNDLAILIEHGIYLKYTNDATKIVNELSKQYEEVILASCDSQKYTRQNENVIGFVGQITVEDVIVTLNKYYDCNLEITSNVLNHPISDFVLEVSYYYEHWAFSGTTSIACGLVVALNKAVFQIDSKFMWYVSMDTGNPYIWGGSHINKKCYDGDTYKLVPEGQVYNDYTIDEILTSANTHYAIILDETMGRIIFKAVIFKYFPEHGGYQKADGSTGSFNIIDLVIGPNPDKVNAMLTILTMHAMGSDTTKKWLLLLMMLNSVLRGYPENEANLIICPQINDITKARYTAPYAIAALVTPVPTGTSNDEIVGDGVNFIWVMAILGSIALLTVILEFDDILKQRFGEGTARYYAVWTATITALVAALVATAILVYFLGELVAAAIVALGPYVPWALLWLAKAFSGGKAAILNGELQEENNPDVSSIDIYSGFYDDDNDGIPNEVEKSYHEDYIEEIIDGTITFYEFDGPCDDGEIDFGLLENPNTWLDPYLDYDSDGLITMTEVSHKINPFNSDTDNDGLLDNEELIVEGTITDEVVQRTDYDKDNQIDTQIIPVQHLSEIKSNPNAFDTDQDGVGDYKEINEYGTSPLFYDSDEDGLLDGWEIYAAEIGWNGQKITDTDKVHPLNPPTDPNWVDSDEDGDGLTVAMESGYFTNPETADTDGDLLEDGWEAENGFDPTDSSDGEFDHDEDTLTTGSEVTVHETCWFLDDTDNDGWRDDYEIELTLTNPTLADTDSDGIDDVDEFDYWISIGVDVRDAYDYCDDIDVDNDLLIDGLELFYDCDPLILDTDGDGLLDGTEILIYNTIPTVADSDADGLTDFEELFTYFTNPNDDDHDNDGWKDGYEVHTTGTYAKKADSDFDGIKDKTEFNYWKNRGKTNAVAYAYCKNDDVDNDGLEDGDELLNGSDPLDNDSDNDGLLDGLEVNNYHTDPDDPDSDNDGYDDLYEIINGTDPNDASDYPGAGGGGFGF
ncbi:MAG: hypothetical protein ACTSO7_13025 [Candidatus Heimdallarchaeota archaeon]